MEATMQAATHTIYGGPQVLSVNPVARPSIQADEVLVRVRASSVTQGDRRLRAADFPGMMMLPGRLMFGLRGPRNLIPGSTFAGEVVEIGDNVTRFAVGERVFGLTPSGAQAEYMAIRATAGIARMPEALSFDEATALPYGGFTALSFLRDLGEVKAGERVLIVGASGEVGRMAVQLARHMGAEVTGVASRDLEAIRALGAHHVIDYRAEDFTAHLGRYDVILDTSGTATFGSARRALSARGRFLSLHVTMGLLMWMLVTALFGTKRALCGVEMGDADAMDQLRELIETSDVRPTIDSRFGLDQIAEAHARVERKQNSGSVVVTMG